MASKFDSKFSEEIDEFEMDSSMSEGEHEFDGAGGGYAGASSAAPNTSGTKSGFCLQRSTSLVPT